MNACEGGRAWLAIGLQLVAVGCGPSIKMGRIGGAVALPTGPARNACEAQGWHEIAPARATAEGAVSQGLRTVYYSEVFEGVGVFRAESDTPLETPDILPAMQEPELQAAHMRPIEEVETAESQTVVWSLIGLVGLGAGVGTAAAIQEDSPGGAAAAGLSGLAIGLVGSIAALVAQPSGEAQLRASAHKQMFLLGVDDMRAVARGVHRVNGRRRQSCGGPAPGPLPDSWPEAPAPNKTQPTSGPAPAPTDPGVQGAWDATAPSPAPSASDAEPGQPPTKPQDAAAVPRPSDVAPQSIPAAVSEP